MWTKCIFNSLELGADKMQFMVNLLELGVDKMQFADNLLDLSADKMGHNIPPLRKLGPDPSMS